MPREWLAVAGSIDGSRIDLGLRNIQKGPNAARLLGKALAEQGYGIVVYAGGPEFVESFVVSGYTSSDNAQPKSIHVIYPRYSAPPSFPEQASKPALFIFEMDENSNWEVSFYRSLDACSGVVLIGGGQSTLVAGTIAVIRKQAVLALEAFGGAASNVWELLTPSDLSITKEDKHLMAAIDVDYDWAKQLALSVDNQIKRIGSAKQNDLESRKKKGRATLLQALASIFSLVTALTLFILTWDADLPRTPLLAALVIAPILAGASASVLRALWESINSNQPATDDRPAIIVLLGAAAGAVSGLLYVVAQLTALAPGAQGKLPTAAGRLVPFALLTGFLAGFTTDAFFRKLKERDVQAFKLPSFGKGD